MERRGSYEIDKRRAYPQSDRRGSSSNLAHHSSSSSKMSGFDASKSSYNSSSKLGLDARGSYHNSNNNNSSSRHGFESRSSYHNSSSRNSLLSRESISNRSMRRASTGSAKVLDPERGNVENSLSRSQRSLTTSTHHHQRIQQRKQSASRRNVTFQNGTANPTATASPSSAHSRRNEHNNKGNNGYVSFEDENNHRAESPMVTDGGDNNDGAKKHRRTLLNNLTDLPSQSLWEEPVTVKHPKSVIRKIRLMCGKIVETPCVQLSIIVLIIVNAIIMGIATFDFVTENPEVEKAFEQVDQVFLIIFTMELILQLTYRSLGLFMDGWLVFDFVIVVISWSLESLQIVRAFRIFRAFRLITRVGPLRELVMAIGTVMPRIYAIAMLLLLIFYIYGVLFTELFGDLVLSDNFFGSLDVSLFTCMELMTMEWAGVAREVMEEESWAWIIFLSFISITGFIVFNLVIAVVCDAVSVVDQQVRFENEDQEETDLFKLQRAQERIWELTGLIEEMNERQADMQHLVSSLAATIQTSSPPPKGILKKPPDGGGGGEGDREFELELEADDSPDKKQDKNDQCDSMMASISGQSYSSFYGESLNLTHSSSSLDYISSDLSGSNQNSGGEAITPSSRNLLPRSDNESESSEGSWQHDTEAEAATRNALASRGYLNPQNSSAPPTESSGTLQTERSSLTTDVESDESTHDPVIHSERKKKKNPQRASSRSLGSASATAPDRPSSHKRTAPMKSLFSP